MQTRDKIVRQVAKDCNVSIKTAELIIRMQCRMARAVMRKKEHKSIYLRGIGTFIPRSVGKEIAEKKKELYLKKKNNNNNQDEDPIEFN